MAAADYQQTLAWLYALEAAKGMDFKLDRVVCALQRLGAPHETFPSIHVAGTNGKGSVAAMLHAMLGAAGHRVGLYTSPHLVRFTERIKVGDREIREDEVVALASEMRHMTAGIELTFFELATVMAFAYFARRRVEVAVIEVGLGGRLDATNVIDPLVSVITTIGLDHTEFLGETLDAVAAEKAGVIKPGRPVVIGRLPPEAERVVRQVAGERHAPVLALGRDFDVTVERSGLRFTGLDRSASDIRLGLDGSYQRDNMATAVAALTQMPAALAVSTRAVREGLAGVHWPGRFEWIGADPLVLLDGAHNLEGTRALARELATVADVRRVHVLFAVMRDKPWRAMIETLAPLCHRAVVTEVLPPRGAAAADIAPAWTRYCPTTVVTDPAAAWAETRSCAKRGELVLVTGSLFLIGAVYPLCRGGWDVGDRRETGSGGS